MPEYRVTFTKATRASGPEREEYDGVFVYIQPPVNLNPDAVERYLTHQDLQPVERDSAKDEIVDVTVLGSTAEQTTIYASTIKKPEGMAEGMAKKTVEFLQFMGAQAVLEEMQTPDTYS